MQYNDFSSQYYLSDLAVGGTASWAASVWTMPWQYVKGTGYVDSVPEDSGTHPALVVMSATCTVQMRLNTPVDINKQKADGSQVTSVHQFFAVPHNTEHTTNTVQWISHMWHNQSSKHVVWDMTSCSLAEASWCFRWMCCTPPNLHISMNSTSLRSIRKFLPHYTASYPT